MNVKPWEYSNDIKLVDTEHLDIRSRYVALSHCRGKKQIIAITRATEIDRHKEILFDTLSKTFRDAVLTTHRLDVQYPWIDSLCIIQDDAEDWQEQSGKMADVYQQACLVLSASSSADGSGGCFSIREKGVKDGVDATFQGSMRDMLKWKKWTVYTKTICNYKFQLLEF